jgi:hypothetical protein
MIKEVTGSHIITNDYCLQSFYYTLTPLPVKLFLKLAWLIFNLISESFHCTMGDLQTVIGQHVQLQNCFMQLEVGLVTTALNGPEIP